LWSCSEWTEGDTYQATGIANGTISDVLLRDRYVKNTKTKSESVIFKDISNNVVDVDGSSFIVGGKNLLYIPDGTYSGGGVTITVSQGEWVIDGTASESNIRLVNEAVPILKGTNGTYPHCTLKLNRNVGVVGEIGFALIIKDATDTPILPIGSVAGEVEVQSSAEAYADISFYSSSTVFNNYVCKPMLYPMDCGFDTDWVKAVKTYRHTSATKIYADSGIYVYSDTDELMTIESPDVNSDIVCYGDSLTGSSSYPALLHSLVDGHSVINNGIGGESSATITARQGGMTMVVNGITIPATTTPIQISIAGEGIPTNDSYFNAYPIRQASVDNRDGGVNPCYIGGIKGTLTKTQTDASSNDVIYFFTRLAPGAELEVDRPTAIITDNMVNHSNDNISVFWMGTNGGWYNAAYVVDWSTESIYLGLIAQYKSMIRQANADKYIILSLWHTDWLEVERVKAERIMLNEFGRHFINVRKYLVDYGLSDAGIEATSSDLEYIDLGKIPPSLLSDSVHLNSSGELIVAEQLHKRLIELRYV